MGQDTDAIIATCLALGDDDFRTFVNDTLQAAFDDET